MSKEILIIDEEKNICDVLSDTMAEEGYTARTALNYDEALAEFNKQAPSVVILGVGLNNSKLNGLEILREFKAINPHMPVIIMAGHNALDIAKEAMEAGAYDLRCKPFTIIELSVSIRNALNFVELKK